MVNIADLSDHCSVISLQTLEAGLCYWPSFTGMEHTHYIASMSFRRHVTPGFFSPPPPPMAPQYSKQWPPLPPPPPPPLNILNLPTPMPFESKMMHTRVISIFLYAGDLWTLAAELQKRMQAFEMRCYQRLLNIFYKDHITNEKVLRKIQTVIGECPRSRNGN